MLAREDSNLKPPDPESGRTDSQSATDTRDTTAGAAVCTNRGTGDAESAHGERLEALAAELMRLSPEDRATLAAMLSGNRPSD